jgi:hypothetical protein
MLAVDVRVAAVLDRRPSLCLGHAQQLEPKHREARETAFDVRPDLIDPS